MATQPNRPTNPAPALYGITHSNRTGEKLWGKNQFNSAFPAALACYMRDQNIPAVYLTMSNDLQVTTDEISLDAVFNSDLPNRELQFDFEVKFTPYQQYALDDIGGIDLVIKHAGDPSIHGFRRALEIKLTVIPDNTTCRSPEAEWGPEIVIRPASTKYCALGIYDSCRHRRNEVRDIFQDVCGNFLLWNSNHELQRKRQQLYAALELFQRTFQHLQKPFLLQPIWKTEGKSPSLADQAFDIFVWSDFALCATFTRAPQGDGEITRFDRASARLARTLYALSTQERANLGPIYTEMAYDLQTDKEFSLPGAATRPYLDTPRRLRPALNKEVLASIILNGGERLLSPERRFDATIFFTTRAIFEVRAAEGEGAG